MKSDDMEAYKPFLDKDGAIFPTYQACQAAGEHLFDEAKRRMREKELRRDNWLAKFLCW